MRRIELRPARTQPLLRHRTVFAVTLAPNALLARLDRPLLRCPGGCQWSAAMQAGHTDSLTRWAHTPLAPDDEALGAVRLADAMRALVVRGEPSRLRWLS